MSLGAKDGKAFRLNRHFFAQKNFFNIWYLVFEEFVHTQQTELSLFG